jgi:septum formation protein
MQSDESGGRDAAGGGGAPELHRFQTARRSLQSRLEPMASPSRKKTQKIKPAPDIRVILASVSPRREKLLREAGVNFRVVAPKIDEMEGSDSPHLTPAEIALNNAFLKARAVSRRFPDEWVLGADTVVVLEGQLIGKPVNMSHAREIIDRLSGRMHSVITAVFFMRERPFHQVPFFDISKVTFHRLSPRQRDLYLESIDPMDKAGAYAVQEKSDLLIKQIEGSRTNVMGLPLEKLMEVLDRVQRHSSGVMPTPIQRHPESQRV